MKKYNGLIKAKVRWFDNVSGEGFVRMPDGTSIFCHRSSFGPLFDQYINLNNNDVVYVTIHEDFHWTQISTLIALKEVL